MKDGIISSLEDIDVLAKKQTGRILVFSDTHSVNPDLLREVVENFAQDVDVMLFCGDGISDLEEIIQESINDEKLLQLLNGDLNLPTCASRKNIVNNPISFSTLNANFWFLVIFYDN